MPRSVGAFLKSSREDAGLTRKSLATAVGVSSQEVKWWEDEGRLPDPGVLPAVADALSVSLDLLHLRAGWVPPHRLKAMEAVLRGEPAAPEAPREAAELPAPHFETPAGALFSGDCISVMRSMPSRSVDCIFADPPFNLDKDYGDGVDDKLSGEDYLAWSHAWVSEAVRLLKHGGSLFLYNIPKWNIHLATHLDRYLQFRHWIAVDIKFSLPIQGRLYPSHYSLLYFVKGARPAVFAPPRLPMQACRHCGGELRDYGGYKNKMNPAGVNLTDVWFDIPPVRHRRYKNRGANELALKMLDRVLDIATNEGDVVLDPFAGSGTTLAACELRGRRWLGIEIGDCEPIVDRITSIESEREQLDSIHAGLNTLFTPATLALRDKSGHDTTRYRLLPELAAARGRGPGARVPARAQNELPLFSPEEKPD